MVGVVIKFSKQILLQFSKTKNEVAIDLIPAAESRRVFAAGRENHFKPRREGLRLFYLPDDNRAVIILPGVLGVSVVKHEKKPVALSQTTQDYQPQTLAPTSRAGVNADEKYINKVLSA